MSLKENRRKDQRATRRITNEKKTVKIILIELLRNNDTAGATARRVV